MGIVADKPPDKPGEVLRRIRDSSPSKSEWTLPCRRAAELMGLILGAV
jgi:hypothetical protein